jgi:hypothetical protein
VNQPSKVVIAGFAGQHSLGEGSRFVVVVMPAPDTVVGDRPAVIRDTDSIKVHESYPAVRSEPKSTRVLRPSVRTP